MVDLVCKLVLLSVDVVPVCKLVVVEDSVTSRLNGDDVVVARVVCNGSVVV